MNHLSSRSGTEVPLRELILGSLEGPIEHAVVVLRPDGHVVEPFADAVVPVFLPQGALGRWGSIRHVQQAVDEFDPDPLHTSLLDAELTGQLAAWTARKPVVTRLVNTGYGEAGRSAESQLGWKLDAVNLVDHLLEAHATTAFHAISRAAAEQATAEYLGVAPQRIRVVHRGRSRATLGEPSVERRRVRRQQGWDNVEVGLNVARQEPQHGHVHLESGFARAAWSHPDAKLVLVGRSARASDVIQAQVEQHGLQDRVVMPGARTDVADLLVCADVFTFPSLYEKLGGALIEACALSLPAISSDLPPLREAHGNEHRRFLPPGDDAAWGERRRDALDDPQRARSVGQQARYRFERSLDSQVMIDGMLALYQDAMTQLSTRATRGLRRVRRLPEWP